MITAVVLVPAAPWLIPGVAPALLTEQAALWRSVVASIEATTADGWAALGVGGSGGRPGWDPELPTDLGPDPYRGRPASGSDVPGGHHVARALLGSRALAAGSLVPGEVDAGVVAGLAELALQARSCALLVTADGSTGHGEHAPGAPDARAADYDAALHRVLAAGPDATRAWLDSAAGSLSLAQELGATLPTAVSAVLHAVGDDLDGWDVSADEVVVPYGVGHHVVRWSRR